MAAVSIIRPPLCGDPAHEVPRAQWPLLLRERQRFCRDVMPSDCSLLLFFVEDGARSDWLGFGSRASYLKDGLGLDPEMVGLALRGLKLTRPDYVIGMDQAVLLGRHGGDRRSEEAVNDQGDNVTLKERGNARSYIMARLDRDRPDLLERVVAGDLSANAAAIEAGFKKKPTSLDVLIAAWRKASAEERAAFLREIGH